MKPTPTIKTRAIDQVREQLARSQGIDPLIARLLASRPFRPEEAPIDTIEPKLKNLDSPFLLADMDRAVARLLLAVGQQQVIAIETDHDCDGQTSHAVIYTALTDYFQHPKDKIQSYIGHRLKEGYGLSPSVMQRILDNPQRPDVVITADNGSSDEAQIRVLKQAGIDVIVTDHHALPLEGPPASALAVINPTREDSVYPDRCIAGCMVAWLLMAATRHRLAEQVGQALPSLADCLDFVAVGTIADCVSIARSQNNRAVVAYGMRLIAKGTRPCWRALLPNLNIPLTSEDLGFKIGPLLNSDGRLACAFGSVSFLLAETDEQAKDWVLHLTEQNQQRKAIQNKISLLALQQAEQQYAEGRSSITVFLEDGHAGVHGISASRLKDTFGRPVIIFCPKEDDPNLITGSARSIDGLHLKEVLEAVYAKDNTLLTRFGGHQGAAGLSLPKTKFNEFSQQFEQTVKENVDPDALGPVIWTDGTLKTEQFCLTYLKSMLNTLEPFGREFEAPLFECDARVLTIKLMGQENTHARLQLAADIGQFEAVWFNCRQPTEPLCLQPGDVAKVVYSPKIEVFRGQEKLKCHIAYIEPMTIK